MSIYKKIGKLLKKHKFYEIYCDNQNKNYSSKNIDVDIHNLIFDLVVRKQNKIQNIFNTEIVNILECEDAQKIKTKCTLEEQIVLISILEIQLNLKGKEQKMIEYEKTMNKIIDKSIYNVIYKEVHLKLHEPNSLCYIDNNEKDKNDNDDDNLNIKYENIDTIICELGKKNTNIEFIALKSIYVSFVNITLETIEQYIDMINSYSQSKRNIFGLLLRSYIEMSGKCYNLQKDFKKSLDCFCKKYKIIVTLQSLFRDIFWDLVFHNQKIGCKFIFDYLNLENQYKVTLTYYVQIFLSIHDPVRRDVIKLLKLENILDYKEDDCDLFEKINDKSKIKNKLQEIKDIEILSKAKIVRSKNQIKIYEKEMQEYLKDESDDEDGNLNSITSYKKRVFYIDEDEDKETKNIFSEDKKDDIDSITIIHEKIIASDVKSESSSNKDLKDEETKKLNKDIISNNNDDIKEAKKSVEENNGEINMENKSLDEIYEYIIKDNNKKKKNKKKLNKNKNKNKAKIESENISNNTLINNNNLQSSEINNDYNLQNYEDPIVSKFKRDLCEKVIFAGSINKIRPVISNEWIKYISSY